MRDTTDLVTFGEDLTVIKPEGKITIESPKKQKRPEKVKYKNLFKFIRNTLSALDNEWEDCWFTTVQNEAFDCEDENEEWEERMKEIDAQVELLFNLGAHFGISHGDMYKFIPRINGEYTRVMEKREDVRGQDTNDDNSINANNRDLEGTSAFTEAKRALALK